jgi:hypothetical protein
VCFHNMAESFYTSIRLWGLFYIGQYQRTYIKILFTGQDNATIGFFSNKMMVSKKKVR